MKRPTLALLLLVGGASLAGGGQAVSPARKNRTHNQGPVQVSFEFAPVNGAGMGTACACTIPTGSKHETLTFPPRSSNATCLKTIGTAPQLIANGDLVTCPANRPRVMPGTSGTAVLALLIEDIGVNVALYSEQIDNLAAWAPANSGVAAPVVTANAAQGPCGAASATCGLAERVQIPATTVAGGQYSFWYQSTATVNPASGQIFFRGNGTSSTTGLALYGPNGWHDADCSYVSAGWTQCRNENVGQFGSGVAAIGFGNFSGLAFSGGVDRGAQDFFVWGVDLKNGAAISSYVSSAGTAGTRSAEQPPYVTLGLPISGSVSIAATFITPVAGHAYGDGILGLSASSAPSAPGIAIEYNATGIASAPYSPVVPTSMGCFRQVGDLVGYTQDTLGFGGTQANTGRIWCATSGAAGSQSFYGQLTGFYATSTRGFALAPSNVVVIGGWSMAAPPLNGLIEKVCVRSGSACADGNLQPARIAWVGDSIVYGFPNPSTSPSVQLNQLLGPQGKTVTDLSINGSTTPDCAARWTADVQGHGYATLIWSCAVNDVASGNTGSFTASTVEALATSALNDGERVVITGIMPWKGSSQWSSGKNVEGLAYNSLISAWAADHGATYVDTSSMGGEGGDPDVLLAQYDSADHVHPTVLGQVKVAQLVQAASP